MDVSFGMMLEAIAVDKYNKVTLQLKFRKDDKVCSLC